MTSSKKIFLIGLIPVILIVCFIVLVVTPSVENYFEIQEQVKAEKTEIENTKTLIVGLKNNVKTFKQIEELNKELADFSIEFPEFFEDEIVLIDFEQFAVMTTNKILVLNSKKEQEIKIRNPEKEKAAKKKKKKRKKKNQPEEIPLVRIIEKPFELKTVAYYNEVIDFINLLDSYQRKVVIKGISAKIFKEDKENPNPRVELVIKGSTFKSVIQKIQDEQDSTKDNLL